MHSEDRSENASQSVYMIICGLTVTFTYDILTSKPTHFIFVHNSTKVVNLVEFAQAVYKMSC